MRFGICVALLAHLQLISCLHGAKLQLSKHLSGSAAVGGGSHAQMQHNPLELYRAKNVPYYSFGDDASVTLTVNETTLTHSGQWVEVCWKDLPFPSTGAVSLQCTTPAAFTFICFSHALTSSVPMRPS